MAVLGLPLWMGWALKTFSPDDLVQFESYETEGYGRFRLNKVTISHPRVSVSIDELSALSPLNWLLHGIRERESVIFLSLGAVEVILPDPPTQEPKPNEFPGDLPRDVPSAIAYIETILANTDKWLPSATIRRASVMRGEKRIELEAVNWSDRVLTFEGLVSDYPGFPFHLSVNLQSEERNLQLEIPQADLELKSSLQQSPSQWVANTILKFRENTAFLETAFTEKTWAPAEASWKLSDWDLNLTSLGLNSAYSALSFNLQGKWQDGAVENSLDGHLATGTESATDYFPPIDFKSEIGGDTDSLSVSQFSLDAPGIHARINEPIFYNLQQMELAGNLRFDIDFDLGMLNQEDLQGRMAGILEIKTEEGNPIGWFTLKGTGVKVQNFDFEELDINADLNWPFLQIHNLTARLSTGSFFQVQALADLQARFITEASASGTLRPETLAGWIPEDISLGSVNFNAKCLGPFESIEHEGSLVLESFETETIKPLSASASWNGRMVEIEALQLEANTKESEINLSARGTLDPNQMNWEITRMEIQTQGRSLSHKETPSSVEFQPLESFSFSWDGLALTGLNESISLNAKLQYPRSAIITMQAENFDTSIWVSPWLKASLPQIRLNAFQASVDWNEGPIKFDTTINASLTMDQQPITAKGGITSDGSTIHFDDIQISDTKGPWITVAGDAPVSFYPGETEKIQLHRDGPLNLSFATSQSQNWLDWLSSVSPVTLEKFHSQVHLNGSLNDLGGSYEVEVVTKEGMEDHGMPSTRILANGDIESTRLTISSMRISVLEELFRISGFLDLPDNLLKKLEEPSTEIIWQNTAFDLQIPPSKLSPMRYFFPQLLSTGGEIEANLRGSIADGMEGFFRIKGMNTRAVFPFGSLRDLSADLEFQHSRARLKNISGYIGREPVKISGSLDYRDWKNPTYHFTIAGNDLPLIRKPGLLLRSDLDLVIDKTTEVSTAITGTVNLKDGLFLLNRNTILAGGSAGGRTANTRPPFFAIDIPPLSDWDLDVVLKGDGFMRVKTPASDGVLSLDMRLQGKLKEPYATGRLEFDQGTLFFPFASFEIDYGAAELPLDNPYVPVVELIGSSRRFGYDIGVEITGTAYDPQVHFTSSPPLSSEQIMLMVMAGENPEGVFDYSSTQRASKLGTFISKGLFASANNNNNLLSRLSVKFGENLSEQGKETMEIEYSLNERFQLVGEYDEYDFWNTGLRWRIVQRQVRDEEEPAK